MSVDVVFKVGGGLLKQRGDLDRVLAVISDCARHQRVLIVPGGGPFADAVRDLGPFPVPGRFVAIMAVQQLAVPYAIVFATAIMALIVGW